MHRLPLHLPPFKNQANPIQSSAQAVPGRVAKFGNLATFWLHLAVVIHIGRVQSAFPSMAPSMRQPQKPGIQVHDFVVCKHRMQIQKLKHITATNHMASGPLRLVVPGCPELLETLHSQRALAEITSSGSLELSVMDNLTSP